MLDNFSNMWVVFPYSDDNFVRYKAHLYCLVTWINMTWKNEKLQQQKSTPTNADSFLGDII